MKYKHFISCTLLFAIFFFIYQSISWDLFFVNILKANIGLLILAIFFALLWPLLSSLRWFFILKELGYTTNFYNTLKVVMVSFSANIFAPAKTGDFVKIICHREIKNKSKLFSGVIFDRFLDLLSLSFLCFFFSFFISNNNGILIGFFVPFLLFLFFFLIEFFIKKKKFVKFLSIIKNSYQLFFKKNRNTLIVLFFSLINWLSASIQIYFFFLAYGHNVSLLNIFSLFPFVVLLSLLPITPSGIGLREVSFIYIFNEYSAPHISLMVSLSYYVFNLCLTGLIGTIFISKYIENKNLTNIKKVLKNKINIRELLKRTSND